MTSEAKTLLIVDDEPAVRKLVKRKIADDSFTIYEAENGLEALKILAEKEVHVVISDLAMPGMGGLELVTEIKKQFQNVPVIILSGKGGMDDAIMALKLGAHEYLHKPLEDRDLLMRSIQNACRLNELNCLSHHFDTRLEETIFKQTKIIKQEFEARRIAEAQLQNAHQDWQKTFDSLPDLIAIIDKNNTIIRANSAMVAALSDSEESIVGRKCFSCIHHTSIPPASCPHQKTLADGKSHTIETYDEKLGGHIEVSTSPYRYSESRETFGSVHIIRNINERKEKEEAENELQYKLMHSQKLESIGQLAAGIAHEINTPIQFLSTNHEFLSESFEDLSSLINEYRLLVASAGKEEHSSEQVQTILTNEKAIDIDYLLEEIPQALSQVKEGEQRIAKIVRAMKEFSHPGTKEKELVDIHQVIDTILTISKNEWKYVADIKKDYSEQIPVIQGYRDELGQVFLNLIINAAHAIEEKQLKEGTSEKGTISVVVTLNGKNIEVKITDTGGGIPEALLEKIFDPFFTTKKVGKGTGQGLAIAKNAVVNKHGGDLSVESSSGRGTCFTICLPI